MYCNMISILAKKKSLRNDDTDRMMGGWITQQPIIISLRLLMQIRIDIHVGLYLKFSSVFHLSSSLEKK